MDEMHREIAARVAASTKECSSCHGTGVVNVSSAFIGEFFARQLIMPVFPQTWNKPFALREIAYGLLLFGEQQRETERRASLPAGSPMDGTEIDPSSVEAPAPSSVGE